MAKLYGFSKIGQRIMAEKSGNRKGKRISVIAVRNHKHQLLHPFYFEGSTNKEIFKTYLTKILLLNLPKDSYLIIDNASFHKGEEIENLIKESNIKLIYLPTYSPDLNPIEKKWAQVKYYYRKLTHYFEDKIQLLDLVLTENKYARLI
jgi:transposase